MRTNINIIEINAIQSVDITGFRVFDPTDDGPMGGDPGDPSREGYDFSTQSLSGGGWLLIDREADKKATAHLR